MRWERVPILGNNPVFCFELRRIWRWRLVLILLAVLFGCGIAGVALERLLDFASLGGLSSRPNPLLWSAVRAPLPPALPIQMLFYAPTGDKADQDWRYSHGYLLMWVLAWLVSMTARYVIPAIGASAVSGDRSQRRLESLLVTRMAPSQILLGKLAAMILPVGIFMLVGAAATAPLSLGGGEPVALVVLWPVMVVTGLFPLAAVGLALGAWLRHLATAVGLSILVAGVILPLVCQIIRLAVCYALLGDPYAASGDAAVATALWLKQYLLSAGISVLLHGLIFAGLWLSAVRGLWRAAE